MSLRSLENSSDERELSELMRKSQDGDTKSYDLLLRKIQVMLKSFIDKSFLRLGLASYGGQEDVLQEILLAIHHKRCNYDPEQFFLPWLYAIAHYKVVDYLRRNKKMVYSTKSLAVEEEVMNFDIATLTDFSSKYDVEVLCKMLPDKQQSILRMIKLEGLSIEEVKSKTGYSMSDIKISIHRAIKFLQENV